METLPHIKKTVKEMMSGKEMALPRTVYWEDINGGKAEKQFYSDDSYGIRQKGFEKVVRYLSDGTEQTYKKDIISHKYTLRSELLPDGTKREWVGSNAMHEELPDGRKYSYFSRDGMHGKLVDVVLPNDDTETYNEQLAIVHKQKASFFNSSKDRSIAD